MYSVGIDLGSRTSKIIFLESSSKISYKKVVMSGINPSETASELLEMGMESLSLGKSAIGKIYSTGYGRNIVKFADKRIPEIRCHTRGVQFFHKDVATVIDIGGQDSKVISVGENGRVIDFAMNDKCAAGTGRFLEVTASILHMTVDEMSELGLKSKEPQNISSVCVVFAESEIIGLIAKGVDAIDIVAGVHNSVAKKTKNIMSGLICRDPIVFTGGVANNKAMKSAIETQLNKKIFVPDIPSITGALGAALFAYEAQ